MLGGTLLWPLTPPSGKDPASPLPAWRTWGPAGGGGLLPSAAQSPGAPVGTGGSAPPTSRSELIALLVTPRSPSLADAPAALFTTRGGGGQSWAGGRAPGWQPLQEAWRGGPLLGVETGWALLVSVGGGLGGACGGSRASLGSGVQEAVTGASPPYPSLGPRETLAPLSATRNTGWRGTPTGAELWVLPPPSSPPAPDPRKGGHGLLFPSGGHELLLQVKRWIRQSHTPAGDPWPGCGARLTLLRPGAWVGGAPQTDPIPGLRGPVCL